jgi:NitT/TauT family transport system ATP-binding protein
MLMHFSDVSKAFVDRETGKGLLALKGIELSVEEGEFLCLIGPSGCGKSTLLNLAAGFDVPSKGKVTLHGTEVTGPDPSVGMVFQEYCLFPWLSVIENIEFGLKNQGVPRAERRVKAREMLELVDLSKFENARPNDLSGGMRQKVAIARTLVLEPEILLMDEPFGALDEQARKHMDLELLKIWQRQQMTMVFVTHNIEEAIMLGTRIVLLGTNPGHVHQEWQVALPRPRDIFQPEMVKLRMEISRSLQDVLQKCGCKRAEIYTPILVTSDKTEKGSE